MTSGDGCSGNFLLSWSSNGKVTTMLAQIEVSSSKLKTKDGEMTVDEARDYVTDCVLSALDVFDTQAEARAVMWTEGLESDPVQKVEITIKLKGKVLHQEAHSRDIRKAIDRAYKPLRRQMRKFKTQKIDYRRAISLKDKHGRKPVLQTETS